MQNIIKHLMPWSRGSLVLAMAAFLLAGCQSNKTSSTPSTANITPPAVPTPAPASAPKVIRINAGATDAYTDSAGNVWLPDQGFADGDTVDRGGDVEIANTKDAPIYRTEHWGMTAFSYNVPNGKYIVKLHFNETSDPITGPGQRVFSFSVGGHDFKDFDVWVKAGGPHRPYVETMNVDVTNGKLAIAFTPNVENPEINGIEIIPAT
jgi:hypothetical protein